MADDIPFNKLSIILTFFVLAAAISHGGLNFIRHIPRNKLVLNLFGNSILLSVFDQITTLP